MPEPPKSNNRVIQCWWGDQEQDSGVLMVPLGCDAPSPTHICSRSQTSKKNTKTKTNKTFVLDRFEEGFLRSLVVCPSFFIVFFIEKFTGSHKLLFRNIPKKLPTLKKKRPLWRFAKPGIFGIFGPFGSIPMLAAFFPQIFLFSALA